MNWMHVLYYVLGCLVLFCIGWLIAKAVYKYKQHKEEQEEFDELDKNQNTGA